ncbi:MAG: class I SAM-dependent rRNA methyltransferase [Thermodesulfobacteriota bacterium]
MGRLVISAKGLAWWRQGHPWVYRDDLEKIEDAFPGNIVILEDKKGRFLAQGFYSSQSKIAFRLITRSTEQINAQFWKRRIQEAYLFRQKRGVLAQTNAYRLIYGEADGIPSLIVDRYDNHFVLQTLSLATDNLLSIFIEVLQDIFSPTSITLRNDLQVRALEGLPLGKKVLWGNLPARVKIFEGQLAFWVDLYQGQKTGAFLDQRENRLLAAQVLKGNILDAFCYQGWFALQVARNSVKVIGVDSSAEALELAKENALLNGISNLELVKDNVFDFLKEAKKKERNFQGIILDPPAFAKSKEDLATASRGYKEINLRALHLLCPGGILVTSSCSYNLLETRFLEILRECARDAKTTLKVLYKRGQSADHPVLLNFPESSYLKCFFLEKINF